MLVIIFNSWPLHQGPCSRMVRREFVRGKEPCDAAGAGMVAKPRIWMFGFHPVLCMFLLFVAGLSVYQDYIILVHAQGSDGGTLYLDQRELEVQWIAGNATFNNAICGSLDDCSGACSRVRCYPVSDGAPLQCTSVDSNELFNICPSGSCEDKIMLDYSRSFVTLPAPASTNLQTEVARDICFQRKLDSIFKTMSFPSNYSVVYFGSSSGAHRGFPGREKNESVCTSFDPRKRPWYLNGISVKRDVKILVDVANSMGSQVTAEYSRPIGTTYLGVVKNITLTLLQTFSPEDYVEVFPFDSTGIAASLVRSPVHINSSFEYFNPNPELAALVTDVNKLSPSSLTTGLSDLNGAILNAASAFNKLHSLKVIIVLSNGLFVVNSTTFPSAVLLSNKAKLMVYKLPTNDDDGDPFLLKTPLQKDICSVNGSFELLDAPATENPLYSMRSYFTYLAGIQLSAVDNTVTWSYKYTSVASNLDAITPTYPAFGSDGRRLLIGVAGSDVVIDNLEEPLKGLVLQAFSSRKRGVLDAPATISMTCFYQNASATRVCPGSTPAGSSAICPKTDTSRSLADLTCCGTCGSGKSGGLKPWMIALITIFVLVAAVVTIVGIIRFWNEKCRQSNNGNDTDMTYPEDR